MSASEVYFAVPISAMERMLESAKAYRRRVNHKIAWCWTAPPLGWFWRLERLEREYVRANNGVRDLIRTLRDARPKAGTAERQGPVPGTNPLISLVSP